MSLVRHVRGAKLHLNSYYQGVTGERTGEGKERKREKSAEKARVSSQQDRLRCILVDVGSPSLGVELRGDPICVVNVFAVGKEHCTCSVNLLCQILIVCGLSF